MTMSDTSIQPDYAALATAPVCAEPFPHVVVPHFIRMDDLPRLFASLPDIQSGGSFPPSALTLSPLMQSVVQAMEGPELRRIIAEKFHLDLDHAPTMLTIRGRTREKDGRIHTDSLAKRVTVLLYLNPAEQESWHKQEGCVRLLRGPHDIEDYAKEVPPVEGTLLIFPNGPTTWHGHRQFVGQRYTIQLNYMTEDARARSELRRHQLSAMAKKISLPGLAG
ncbi:2OG-Fe(II) oxygenase family protein [Acetobacter cerevisiae]|uniref:2OG-Fe(II) oxygenase family protein n=1 Tax=Acetobacter cerevisiae TaxID=178900 RepID=UPI00209FD253|nr:2OG-Fe(II) oxygenase [Acetobacter cerevisiae]MCP1271686.1 2OG-Fe(II) oxygenase [Acetobacter cerevisiae]MCP1279639.1 2OG-Fe(II) oxygenase [Acetobacter cerevisiae]